MNGLYPHSDPCYRCAATAWEYIESSRSEDIVGCVFCGVRMRVCPKEQAEEFRFQFGRFKGLTLAEADGQEYGRKYLEHLRDNNAKLRDRIVAYLTTATA